MGVGEPTTVAVGPQTQQICPALGAGEHCVVYNTDLTNTVYAGYQKAGLNANFNTVAIAPLGSATMDARRTIYATCPTGTINVTVLPGGLFINPAPSQIAQQIAASGVGLLNNSTPLTSVPSQSIPIATPLSRTIPGVTGVGYMGQLSVGAAFNATKITIRVDVSWIDSKSGLTVASQRWWITAGTIGSPNVVNLQGPIDANQLNLVITAFGNAVTYSDNWLQNGLVFRRHDWRSSLWANTQDPGVVVPQHNTSSLELAIIPSVALAATATNQYLLPLYSGRARLWAQLIGGNAGDLLVQTLNWANQAVGSNVMWQSVSPTSDGNLVAEIALSRSQTVLSITNNNAAAKNIQAALVMEEY